MKRITFYKFTELPESERHDCVVAICDLLAWTDVEFDEELIDIMNQFRFTSFEEAVDRIMNWNGLYYSYRENLVIQIEQEMLDFRAKELVC